MPSTRLLPAADGSIAGRGFPILSPDGTFFRFSGEGVVDVVVVPIGGGAPYQIRGLEGRVFLGGWTEAGELFFSTGEDGKRAYFLWNPARGEQERVELPEATLDYQGCIHPDGRQVLYSTAQPPWGIYWSHDRRIIAFDYGDDSGMISGCSDPTSPTGPS